MTLRVPRSGCHASGPHPLDCDSVAQRCRLPATGAACTERKYAGAQACGRRRCPLRRRAAKGAAQRRFADRPGEEICRLACRLAVGRPRSVPQSGRRAGRMCVETARSLSSTHPYRRAYRRSRFHRGVGRAGHKPVRMTFSPAPARQSASTLEPPSSSKRRPSPAPCPDA